VKYIQKSKSPEKFENWKENACSDWQPCWDNFQNPEKEKVKEALLIEQGYICCYCGMRIQNDSSTEIEHIKPRKECIGSEEYKALAFDNFLASCNGSKKDPKPREVHCNNARGDQFLAVNPLTVGCEDKFAYTLDGKVIASNDDADIRSLIDTVLRLNAKKIKGFREKLINALHEDFSHSKEDDVREEILALSHKENDKFKAMCFVSVSYLQNNFL